MLDHVERDDAEAVIVMREWTRHPFWRRIESGAWRQRLVLDLYLEPGAIEANPENEEHCFFGNGLFDCRLRVIRTKKLGGATENVVAGDSGVPPLSADTVDAPTHALPDAARRRPRSAANRHERRKRARSRASVPPLAPAHP